MAAARRYGSAWSAANRSIVCGPKIETALQRCGLEPERRRFQPHVTLARLDNGAEAKVAAFVQAHNLFRADPVPMEHFTLFSSLLGKDQPVYTAEVALAQAHRVIARSEATRQSRS